MGEVIAAAEWLRQRGIPERGFHALIAIAEKAGTSSRQASVPWSHIRAGLYGASLSTAKRAVKDLKSAGVLRVIKRGYDNHHGGVAAPIYEIGQLGDWVTQVSQSSLHQRVTQLTQSVGGERVTSGGRTGQIGDRTAHPGDLLNGSTNGSTNGTRATHPGLPRCNGRNCSICPIIRAAIKDCDDCDDFGRLHDDLSDCPKHGNFRVHPPKRKTPA